MQNGTRLDGIDPSFVRQVAAMADPYGQFVALVDALIDRNPKLQDGGPADAEAQRALATVAALDVQIQNGGLMQFFLDRPELVEQVGPALRRVGVPALADHFEQAVAQLAGGVDRFVERREAGELDDFIAASEENDFDGFEDLYFGDFDRASGRWSGMVDELYRRSVAFVLGNIDAFVRPNGEARK